MYWFKNVSVVALLEFSLQDQRAFLRIIEHENITWIRKLFETLCFYSSWNCLYISAAKCCQD